jgi:integrase
MSNTQKPKAATSDWKKIGPCLYRFKQGDYYALVKRKGKQIRRSLKTSDLALARRNLTKFLADLERLDLDLGRQTLETFAQRFRATLRGAEATISKKELDLRILLETWPKDAPRALAAIKKDHCDIWAANGAQSFYANGRPVKDRKLGATRLRDRLLNAKEFFEAAVDAGAIATNPMRKVKLSKRSKVIRNTPSEEQFRAILDDLRRQRFNGHGPMDSADFVELAGTLGLGQAELSNIQRQHIDLEKGFVQVRRKKTGEIFKIPIFHDARAIIERRLAEMPEEPTARLLPHDNCKKALQGACKRLGLPHFEPRSLRRYHITRCIREGIDIPTIAKWQGHQDGGELILSTYSAEVEEKHSLEMAAKLAPRPANVIEMKQEAAG